MRVLFVSSEVYPFSKTGGLGDVAGSLPPALAGLGHEVLVVTPWYATLKGGAPLWIGDIEIPFAAGTERVGVGTLERDGVRYAFVGHESFRRERLYGYPDDIRRFALFSRSVPQVAARLGFRPHVVHANDWHSAYLPIILQRGWHLPDGFPFLPSVITVHNAQYQGESDLGEVLHWLRLPDELRGSYLNHFGRANALQGGLGFADAITTVSPTYAQELMTPEAGFGLDGTFRHLQGKLTGILNGLDTGLWDPANDPHIPQPYSAQDPSGKRTAKRQLTERFGLAGERPLMAVVSRLVEQKGIDIFCAAARSLVEGGWSLLVLGSGDRELEEWVAGLARDEEQIAAHIGYDETLAHLVYAAADAVAIPSRFEPCGLTQMIGMRYGALPIARQVGGLRDTIRHGETGFLFCAMSASALLWAAGQALERWHGDEWNEMMGRAMRQDFSWERSAGRYLEVYAGALHGDGDSA